MTTPLSKLTPKQRKIATLVVRGLRNREIARELGIAENTVKCHLQAIYAAFTLDFGAGRRLQLALAVLDDEKKERLGRAYVAQLSEAKTIVSESRESDEEVL